MKTDNEKNDVMETQDQHRRGMKTDNENRDVMEDEGNAPTRVHPTSLVPPWVPRLLTTTKVNRR